MQAEHVDLTTSRVFFIDPEVDLGIIAAQYVRSTIPRLTSGLTFHLDKVTIVVLISSREAIYFMKKAVLLSFLIIGLAVTQAHAFDPENVETVRDSLSATAATGMAKKATAFSAAAKRNAPTTAVASASGITKTLSLGLKKDPQVVTLQSFLIANGYLVATADGNFGPKTQAAVKKFQTANGISPLGIVGPQTRALIK